MESKNNQQPTNRRQIINELLEVLQEPSIKKGMKRVLENPDEIEMALKRIKNGPTSPEQGPSEPSNLEKPEQKGSREEVSEEQSQAPMRGPPDQSPRSSPQNSPVKRVHRAQEPIARRNNDHPEHNSGAHSSEDRPPCRGPKLSPLPENASWKEIEEYAVKLSARLPQEASDSMQQSIMGIMYGFLTNDERIMNITKRLSPAQ